MTALYPASCWHRLGHHASSQQAEETARSVIKSGKDCVQVRVAQVPVNQLSEHYSEVCGQGEVAAFVELRWIESRPAAIHSPAPHWPAKYKHDIRVAVIGAAVSILTNGAPKFRHGDDH